MTKVLFIFIQIYTLSYLISLCVCLWARTHAHVCIPQSIIWRKFLNSSNFFPYSLIFLGFLSFGKIIAIIFFYYVVNFVQLFNILGGRITNSGIIKTKVLTCFYKISYFLLLIHIFFNVLIGFSRVNISFWFISLKTWNKIGYTDTF